MNSTINIGFNYSIAESGQSAFNVFTIAKYIDINRRYPLDKMFNVHGKH